ncbi:hypothetical protein BU17DRAFT_85690 [Hysterangium stoloniferum]|nr:hypothetical protein BU17DRAFT_85690 [Hysterangium stoloniferum]
MSLTLDLPSLSDIGRRLKEWELNSSPSLSSAKFIARQLYDSLKVQFLTVFPTSFIPILTTRLLTLFQQSEQTNADLVQLFCEQIQVVLWLEMCMPIIRDTVTVDTVKNTCVRGMVEILNFEQAYSGWLARIFGGRRRAVSRLSDRLHREANESVNLMMFSTTLSTHRKVLDIEEKVVRGIASWEEMRSLMRTIKNEMEPASSDVDESWARFGY